MNSDAPLDYALFQLSPRRTRCELLVSGDGKTEKLASGFLKPFVTHLRVAEEQASQAVQSIKLEVERWKNAATWFNKGTLERFVRFVSTPEVLELVNTFDAEMSQLEGARRIYSQGSGDQLSGASGKSDKASTVAADITKKELLRAIDVRLVAVKQDLTMACARASAAGFTLDNVSELLFFADHFGARRLNEACSKFILLCQQRPELVSLQHSPSPSLPTQWKGFDNVNVRSSSGSDMSIDEPEVEPIGPPKPLTSCNNGPQFVHMPSNNQPPQHAAAELAATVQQPMATTRHLVERDVNKATEEPAPKGTSAEPVQQPGGGGLRRLSVQDRINLFESKQKEQTTSAPIVNSSVGGGTVRVAGKPEHRRLPSDGSLDKSVLRRWSGGSDMSIGLNSSSSSSNDRKESGSTAGALLSTANSHSQAGSKTEEDVSGSKDTATSRSHLGFIAKSTGIPLSSSSLSLSQEQVGFLPKDRVRTEDIVFREGIAASKRQSGPALEKEHGDFRTPFGVPLGEVQQGEFSDQTASKSGSKTLSDSGEGAVLKGKAAFGAQFKALSEEYVGVKDQTFVQIPSKSIPVAEQTEQVNLQSQSKNVTGRDAVQVTVQPNSVTKFRTFAMKAEDVEVKSKAPQDPRAQFRGSSGKTGGITQKSDLLDPQSKWKTLPGKEERVGSKEADASQVSLGIISVAPAEEVDSSLQGMKLDRQTSTPDQISMLLERRNERVPHQVNAAPPLIGKKPKESMTIFDSPSTSSLDQVQVVRPTKVNQDMNDELQRKANELEKLFAAHKVRILSDQVASSRRSKPVDVEVIHASTAVEKRLAGDTPHLKGNLRRESSSNEVDLDAKLLLKMVDNRDCSKNTKQELENLSPSDDFRGVCYEKYMHKRDEKLREEWGAKRAQKEAKMKAMHDSLELSQAEMKAKFAGSANRQDLTSSRHRAEKMRSFNACSSIKTKEQTTEVHYEEEDDLQVLPEQVHYDEDKSYSDTLVGNEHSINIQSKKLLSSKSVSSSTPRTPVAPIPRPSVKSTNSSSMKRRTQPENPLAQSVPNFSDFRKENTKPSTGINKVTSRAQSRNYARSKSSSEEMNLVKEDNSRRSLSMRKSSANPGGSKDLSAVNSDGSNLTLLSFSQDQTEQTIPSKIQSGESRPFLRKGNGIGPGAGAGLTKMRSSMASEALKSEEESEGLVGQQENSSVRVKDDEEESERPSAEGNLRTMDFSVDSDGENPRLSQESENSGNLGSENGDVLRRSLSQTDDYLAAISSKFDISAGIMQESPGESPGSWNSHLHHPFSYAQEASDVDASVDSPTGSPTSWNSHPLNQMMEADAARMRKKWGSAQIPVLVANASHQSRKDVTKGFKRLLKFGRKSKGAEFLVNDWVSASTASEGDDDTEDGRDLSHLTARTSDELRKSRMGYPIAAYDGFNEVEIFPEQAQSVRSSIPIPPANFKLREDHLSGGSLKAPRSFFSLSSFRSKGSESKLR